MAKAKKSKKSKAAKKKSKKPAKRAAAKSKRGAAKSKSVKKAKRPAKKAAPAKAKAKAKKAVKKAAPKKKQKIVGEGDYAATRAFDKDQTAFVKRNKAKIPQMGKEAEKALDGPEGESLRAAEQEAMSRSAIE